MIEACAKWDVASACQRVIINYRIKYKFEIADAALY